MKRTLAIYLLLAMCLPMVLLSCKKDKEEESKEVIYTTSTSSALVSEFSLLADTSVMAHLDSVFFTIDPNRGLIYNADSLPVGTDISALKATLSFRSPVTSAVFRVYDEKNNFTDVTYNSTSTDTIDFRYGVTLTVTSIDGIMVKKYDIKVNVHKQNPDSIVWPASARRDLPAAADDNIAQCTAFKDGIYYNLMHHAGGYFVSAAGSPTGPWTSKPADWGFEPDVASFTASNTALFVLDVNGNLHTSSDGLVWTATGVEWSRIIGAYQDRVLGITSEPYHLDEYPRRASFSPVDLPADFPIKGTSQLLQATNDWAIAPQAVMAGGATASGAYSQPIWAYDGNTWAKMGNANGALPALYGPSLMAYVSYQLVSSTSIKMKRMDTWLIMGGRLADGTFNRNTYMSTNQGITWTRAASTMTMSSTMPDMQGAQAFVMNQTIKGPKARWRVAKPTTEWECPFIYLMGGYGNNNQLLNNVWTGVLNRAYFKPLN